MDIVLLVCGLLCGYLIYSQGVRDGLRMKEGGKPALPNPVKYVQEAKEKSEVKKENDEFANALENLMSYNGTKQGGE